MDVNEYIASGILDAYWSGELSEKEMLEVDRMAEEYPEVKAELNESGKAILQYGDVSCQKPDPKILDDVINEIREGDKIKFLNALSEEEEQPIQFKRVNVVPVWSIAASILLVVSAGFNFLFFTEFKKAKDRVSQLENDMEILANDQRLLAERASQQELQLQYADLRIAHFLNKDNIHVRMDGLPISPESYANVFWNTKSNAVFISVDNLPEPPHGHQYQLWAIKPGKAPIDAGVFDQSQLVQELKVIKGNVAAFAVTLEKEGGSSIATVDKTFVKGFLKKKLDTRNPILFSRSH